MPPTTSQDMCYRCGDYLERYLFDKPDSVCWVNNATNGHSDSGSFAMSVDIDIAANNNIVDVNSVNDSAF